MARQKSEGEFNSFVKGLVTEAGPLTFPENASLVDTNFILNKDGSRKRRFGMDYEVGFTEISTTQSLPSTGKIAYTSFLWESAGGDPATQVIVVQVGNELSFLDRNSLPISDGLIHQEVLPITDAQTDLSYASIDGRLVVASGKKEVIVFEHSTVGAVISSVDVVLKTRDLFGVQDISLQGVDLFDGHGINTRTSDFTDAHVYNLRNQTWGPARLDIESEDITDPIARFVANSSATGDTEPYEGFLRFLAPDWYTVEIGGTVTEDGVLFDKNNGGGFPPDSVLLILDDGDLDYEGSSDPEPVFRGNYLIWNGLVWTQSAVSPRESDGAFPSNADSVTEFFFPDVDSGVNKTVDRFHAENAAQTTKGTSRASFGYFIIDVLNRGASRKTEYDNLRTRFPALQYEIESLPLDSTPGGPSVVTSYAGRVFYAGFSGEVVSGDDRSPNLASYVFFSQLVRTPSDVNKCYQEGDPTSKEEPDLLATDGGFLKLDGAYGIRNMVSLGRVLMVLADNGIWTIQGGAEEGFSATNILTTKVSDKGIIAPSSVVTIGDGLVFWSEDGIYQATRNQFGIYESNNISNQTIKTFYEGIVDEDRVHCKGYYDSYEDKIVWLYGSRLLDGTATKELVLDLQLGAFYVNELGRLANNLPLPVSIIEIKPFKLSPEQEDVTHNGAPVTYNGDQVTYTSLTRQGTFKETLYMTITGVSPLSFTFSTYRDTQFLDWVSFDSVGVDAPATLIGGWGGTGEFKRYKQVPYMYVHSIKTETGFNPDLTPINESSCLVQVQWDWANSDVGNRFGRQFQAYRHRRLFIPADSSDSFDDGERVVTTKNKLRGKGRVFSFKITTEPGKDLHLLGWSISLGVNSSE